MCVLWKQQAVELKSKVVIDPIKRILVVQWSIIEVGEWRMGRVLLQDLIIDISRSLECEDCGNSFRVK